MPTPAATAAPEARGTILCIEDHPVNMELVEALVAGLPGVTLLKAATGRDGVHQATTQQPDLVLLDMNLPLKDGWSAAREIRADPRCRGIPIIALTAHAMSDDRSRALAAGCDDYETKPLDFARLLDKIALLLEARGGADAPA